MKELKDAIENLDNVLLSLQDLTDDAKFELEDNFTELMESAENLQYLTNEALENLSSRGIE